MDERYLNQLIQFKIDYFIQLISMIINYGYFLLIIKYINRYMKLLIVLTRLHMLGKMIGGYGLHIFEFINGSMFTL